MQFVDQTGGQKLPDGGYSATKANVSPARRGGCLFQRGVNAAGNKPEFGPAMHGKRSPRVMRQYENRRVIGRLIPPPSLPTLIRPRSPNRAEHVAAENP